MVDDLTIFLSMIRKELFHQRPFTIGFAELEHVEKMLEDHLALKKKYDELSTKSSWDREYTRIMEDTYRMNEWENMGR